VSKRDRDIAHYLRDMLQHAADAESRVVGFDFETRQSDARTNSLVTRGVEVVGEAANRAPSEFRDQLLGSLASVSKPA